MASITDKFPEATSGTRPDTASLTNQKEIGDLTIDVDSTVGWATNTATHFVIYQIDTSGNRVDGTQTDWKGIVTSGTTIGTLTLKAGSDQVYPVGSKVIAAPTAAWADDVVEGMAVEHNQDGTHSDVTTETLTVGGRVVDDFAPAGIISAYGGTAAPTGWLLCYGQNVDRTTYADLFTAIGTTYGVGDGSTTFTLPDIRGRVVAGQDDMGGSSANRLTNQTGGLDGDTLGATGGTETHTLTTAQLAAHTHTWSGTTSSNGSHTHTYYRWSAAIQNAVAATDAARYIVQGENPTATDSQGAHTHTYSGTTSSTGSTSAHNNVQPTIILNYIIKT
jgi:microcystin-dependent protein